MPTFLLKMKAELEGIACLRPLKGNNWKINVVSSGGHSREGITVSDADEQELEGSRGTAHFIIRWERSMEPAYIKLVPMKGVDGTYTKSGEFQTILAMECRGIEPATWIPSTDFDAISSGGKVFEAVDLTDKEWSEFDEDADVAVSILDLEFKIERA